MEDDAMQTTCNFSPMPMSRKRLAPMSGCSPKAAPVTAKARSSSSGAGPNKRRRILVNDNNNEADKDEKGEAKGQREPSKRSRAKSTKEAKTCSAGAGNGKAHQPADGSGAMADMRLACMEILVDCALVGFDRIEEDDVSVFGEQATERWTTENDRHMATRYAMQAEQIIAAQTEHDRVAYADRINEVARALSHAGAYLMTRLRPQDLVAVADDERLLQILPGRMLSMELDAQAEQTRHMVTMEADTPLSDAPSLINCIKCSRDTLAVNFVQTRGADEPTTQYFWCLHPTCKEKWTVR
ncbi:Transcription elongation factor S-II [Mollivirus sibericum]|uniref:Transcription elongation factor S-II n=1 Tax=Mollivirus sibericum TaxID=1678078 RepID=UPI0006B2E3D3|nr:Transcription elongation factor S-II [Mollivirus sibericum]ALD62233.1 Transcription elongation factor S-II [Mollivirus sibericum]